MGLLKSEIEKKNFVNIFDGEFTVKCGSGEKDAIKRINKNEHEVWEKRFGSLNGIITGMQVKEYEFGKVLHVEIEDGETFILSIPVESKYFDSFCLKIGNADLQKNIVLKPYCFLPKGETHKKSGFTLLQDSVKLEYYFSSDQTYGKPTLSKDSPQLSKEDYKIHKIREKQFLCEYIKDVNDRFLKAKEIENAPEAIDNSIQDDLPF